ncbi:hypothetical protein FA15DRAFT_665747 [Coprinopsis marcescibilis]|uniref:F-box domain-containing protein n=1 Tax=Coprinopsis marcescibilis TaxID=230819 RepID=A0A5C3L5T9_COPMA|nr:hypothetical protein FA15DRAFT_665747 [Coprinopsis marcescibilis]
MFFGRSTNQRQDSSTFSRSFTNTFKFKLSLPFFSSKSQCLQSMSLQPPPSPRRMEDIGRPRQLRRHKNTPDQRPPAHFVQRLPVEILALVFIHGSEDDAYFPVIVSHVCKAWRKIAMRTPALWRRITLSPKERMWKERIRRAKACSLDIQLLPTKAHTRSEPRHADLDPYSIQWHMHLVLPHIARWRSLEIVFPEYGPYLWKAALSRCCATRGVPAPLLEDLRLVYRANDDPEEYTLFSGSSPNLRSATVNGIRLKWLPSLFANLTFLDYTHHGFTAGHQAVQDVIEILAVSTSLSELRLTFPRKPLASLPSRNEPVKTRVSLPKLQSLHLRVEGKDIPFELAQIATLLSTPSLTSLRLVDLSRSYHSFASLKSFFYIYALPPSLRSVRIECGWYDPRMITPIVQSHSRVRQIIVKRPHSAEQVLNLRPPPTQSRTKKVSADSTTTCSSLPRNEGSTTGVSDRQFQIQRLNVQYFKAR